MSKSVAVTRDRGDENGIKMLVAVAGYGNRNLQMPGQPRYQPAQLKPYLGYDQWASWLILVEWFWMKTLALMGKIPPEAATLLTEGLLKELLEKITTTIVDAEEVKTRHDIVALLNKMREILPVELHAWLHYCATSYDVISTAYALQYQTVFFDVIEPLRF